MVTFVRISDGGDIVETIEFDPVGRFHPSLQWWPINTVEEKKAALTHMVRTKRRALENGGMALADGTRVQTDAGSQSKIAGGVQLFQNDATLTHIDFEAQPGVWVTLDAATMTSIGIAVGRHVQSCFSRSRVLQEAISAATSHSELDAIDVHLGWPE
tara:strand:+ start:6590 stop:7060 length:471 start_codon:yes stop_codon:yes gene_type:complete